MAHSPTSATRFQAAIRRAGIVQSRLEGNTHRAIAKQEGCSPQRIGFILKEELAKVQGQLAEAATELLVQSLEELEQLKAVYLPKALAGEYKAVDAVLRIMERASKFLSLDAPQRADISVKTDPYSDWSLEDLRRQAKIMGIPVAEDVEQWGS